MKYFSFKVGYKLKVIECAEKHVRIKSAVLEKAE
jgi:hypothetical protein